MYSYREDIRWYSRDLSSIFCPLMVYFETVGKSQYIVVHKYLHINNKNFHKVIWKQVLP